MLVNLEPRGAAGAEKNTGDGAAILLQSPDGFLRKEAARLGIELPRPGRYAAGMVFLPADAPSRAACEKKLEEIVLAEGQLVLGWRDVPFDASTLGETAKASQPIIRQILVGAGAVADDVMAFERKLYVIRRLTRKSILRCNIPGRREFYVASLSCRTIVYKGMLTTGQLEPYFLDLGDPTVDSALALVHSRFSTNTFPSWFRAHPYRYLAHNGEINTLRCRRQGRDPVSFSFRENLISPHGRLKSRRDLRVEP